VNRPPLEVADIVRAYGDDFIEQYQGAMKYEHIKVLGAIRRCRTAALGGHRDRCDRCGHRAISYNSCRSRNCPKCQAAARKQWLADRTAELLPVSYFHVVFTLPESLRALGLQNKRLIHGLLFRASAETLLEAAADPRHLGAEIGFLSVLHTWGQNLLYHPHVHCVVSGGGLTPDRSGWISTKPGFFLPVRVLSRLFRGKFLAYLKRAYRRGHLTLCGRLHNLSQRRPWAAWLRTAYGQDWVVYAKRPFGGPEQVLRYLARYTHRVAISNYRLLSMSQGLVTFRWRDYAHGNKSRKMTLPAREFLRRFLLHVLPRGFVRIRHFGFLANRHRDAMLSQCRKLLPAIPYCVALRAASSYTCPQCHIGRMVIVERLTAAQIQWEQARSRVFDNSS